MFSPLNIRVAFYLAYRQIKRSSKWTTGLIVFVMLLTFLNLVVVTGVLVGLVEGINESYREQYIGDMTISSLDTKTSIEHSPEIIAFIKSLPQVSAVSARYTRGGTLEANYKSLISRKDKIESTGATVIGIDPEAEDKLTHMSEYVIEGSYLERDDYDQILIGSELLEKYSFGGSAPGYTPLKNVEPGDTVRLTIGSISREVTIKGVLKSKLGELSLGVIMVDTQLATLLGESSYSVGQIAMRLEPGTDPIEFRDLLIRSGVGENGKVRTFNDSIPQGVADIKNTFAMLGNVISSVGLVVASITIFIVIFINAFTRRKFIGILKGIGINGTAIEISYMLQALLYALIGSGLGLLVIYGLLVPYFNANPIDFPFSDGILVAPVPETMIRVALLSLATVIAGYIPARMIVKKNTLDSILGRN